MCNCGNKRSQFKKANPATQAIATTASPGPENRKTKFMYIGHNSLKLIGKSSGRTYHFRYRGEVLEISEGDSSFMTAIPELSQVKAG